MSLFALFVASLLGSPHCGAMCGGFVCYYSGRSDNKILSHVSYNLARLLTYTVLGGIFGYLGGSIDLAFGRSVIPVAMGLIMVIFGSFGILGIGSLKVPAILSRSVSRFYSLALNSKYLSPTVCMPFTIGALSTLLPCGWLYTFLLAAAASSSILTGVLIMAVFWLGTLPMMASIGVLFRGLTGSGAKNLPRLTALVLIMLGLASIFGHLSYGSLIECHL